MLKDHFGLRVWAKNISTDTRRGYLDCKMTLTYLTLSDSSSRQDDWDSGQNRFEAIHDDEARLSIPVQVASPTAETVGRFSRAMNILRLQPSVHSSQQGSQKLSPMARGSNVVISRDQASKNGRHATSWNGEIAAPLPQLMLLISTRPSCVGAMIIVRNAEKVYGKTHSASKAVIF